MIVAQLVRYYKNAPDLIVFSNSGRTIGYLCSYGFKQFLYLNDIPINIKCNVIMTKAEPKNKNNFLISYERSGFFKNKTRYKFVFDNKTAPLLDYRTEKILLFYLKQGYKYLYIEVPSYEINT